MEELLSKYGDDLSDTELESIFKDFIKTRKENEPNSLPITTSDERSTKEI